MPQPISKIVADPHIILNTDALRDKPAMALTVCEIFAVWASLERDLRVLLVRMLRSEADAAHAIYSILQSQALQFSAIRAVAPTVLAPDSMEALNAYLSIVQTVKKCRNRLAHWVWGTCKQRPDLLLLADPEMLRVRDVRTARHFQTAQFDLHATWEAIKFDAEFIYAYSADDLLRELRDLKEAHEISQAFGLALDPGLALLKPEAFGLNRDAASVRQSLLRKLNDFRLFREATAASSPG